MPRGAPPIRQEDAGNRLPSRNELYPRMSIGRSPGRFLPEGQDGTRGRGKVLPPGPRGHEHLRAPRRARVHGCARDGRSEYVSAEWPQCHGDVGSERTVPGSRHCACRGWLPEPGNHPDDAQPLISSRMPRQFVRRGPCGPRLTHHPAFGSGLDGSPSCNSFVPLK